MSGVSQIIYVKLAYSPREIKLMHYKNSSVLYSHRNNFS